LLGMAAMTRPVHPDGPGHLLFLKVEGVDGRWQPPNLENPDNTGNCDKLMIVFSVFHGAESSIPAPIAWPCPWPS